VATDRYQDEGLRQLIAPTLDVKKLKEVLRNPAIANFEVEILVNEPDSVVGRTIGEFYRNRRHDDLTLLYFTGHGLKDDQGNLYLAMTNTRLDNLVFTGVSAERIDQAMESCASRRKILVLDCCYSGAFPAGRMARAGDQVHTLERFQGKGRVVLTASDATRYSFEGEQVSGQGIQSVFTHFFIEGLTTGKADLDNDGNICIDELYAYVHDRVREKQPQQRPRKLESVEGRIPIARNMHWQLPSYIYSTIENPWPSAKLEVLKDLDRLHRSGNDYVRAEVIKQVQRLTNDDSHIVSSTAKKLFDQLDARKDHPPVPEPLDGATEKEKVDVGSRSIVNIVGALVAAVIAIIFVVYVAVNGGQPDPNPPHVPTAPHSAGTDLPMPTIDATIAVGRNPNFVVASPDGRHAYVANAVSSGDTAFITVIDITSNRVIATIPIPAGPPQFLAFAPGGRRLYVSVYNDQRTIHEIEVLDTGFNTVVATIPQSARPFLPAVSPDGKLLYVPNHDTASLSVVATDTNKNVAQIQVAANPHWVVFSPDGSRAYITNHESNLISVIDTSSLKIIATIPVGTSPHSIALSPNRPLLADVNYDGNSVSEIDTNTFKVVANIPVGKNPRYITWAPDGRFAYVVNEGSNTVSVIDAATNQVTANIPTDDSPTSLAILPNGKAYVSNSNSGTLTVLGFTG